MQVYMCLKLVRKEDPIFYESIMQAYYEFKTLLIIWIMKNVQVYFNNK